MNEGEGIFIGRHAQRSNVDTISNDQPESEDMESARYPGITEKGVGQAIERADSELKDMVEKLGEGAVVFIGGASEEVRTKSTAEVYGDRLAELYSDDDSVLVITRSEIDKMGQEDRARAVADRIQGIIEANEGKKIVIDYPLFLNGLSLRPGFRAHGTGERTEFARTLGEQSGGDSHQSARLFIKSGGLLQDDGEEIQGPSPQELAENQIVAINRLRDFARKFTGDRQLVVGVVGHGWNLDALAVYLANNGQVTVEGFDEIGGEAIGQSEIAQLTIGEERAKLSYHGREYEVPGELLNENAQ